MADEFVIQAQRKTVAVRSPTLIEDVQELHAITVPSGITFVRDVPYTAWAKQGAAPFLEPIAEHIEAIVKRWPVTSGHSVQRPGASGLLQNSVEFTVALPNPPATALGPMTSTVTVPVSKLFDLEDFASYFQPVLDALAHAAGL